MIRYLLCAALALFASHAGAGDEFPPTTAPISLTVNVGDKVTVGGPKATNFLPNETMDVYVVPHRTWNDGDPMKGNAVHRGRVKSDAKGTIPLTQLWVPDVAGKYDIIIDYDGDGRFSYSLDAITAIEVKEKK